MALVAVLHLAACNNGAPPSVGSTSASLTEAQCIYFAAGGKDLVCHATSSKKNPYVLVKVDEQACINAHVGHAKDYIAVNDPTCQGKGCLPLNAPCDANVPCCGNGVCVNGLCKDLCAGVVCTALDQCHQPGVCDPADGICSDPVKVDGTACDDGDACTSGDACQAGACVPQAISDPTPGHWTRTRGGMVTSRAGHTATLLDNGLVLVAAGADDVEAIDTAELYDPVTDTFALTGSLNTKRDLHIAVKLDDGRVVVLGGRNISAQVGEVEIYDPDTELWTASGSLLFGRWGHTATLLQDGRILVACGSTSGPTSNQVEIYDPLDMTSTEAAPMLEDRSWCMATRLPNGEVLVAGGHDDQYQPRQTTEIYDPGNDTWRPGPMMMAARNTSASVVLHDGRWVLVGGDAPNTGVSAEVFDPLEETWSPYGTPLHDIGVAVLLQNQEILYAGGSYSDQVDRYSVCGWYADTKMTIYRLGQTAMAATLLPSGKVLVTGGAQLGGRATDSAELYSR